MDRGGAVTGGEAPTVGAAGRSSWLSHLERGPVLRALGVLGAAVAVGARVRVWQIGDRVSLGWNDSTDFVAGSTAPWGSLDLWAGRRPPVVPVLLKLVDADADSYVVVQAILAVACWALLAASVSSVVGGRVARWLAPAVVVAFSLTTPVTMWERSVLSESVAVSLLALLAAAALQLAREVTPPRVAATLVALALWLGTRDSHAVVAVLAGGVLVAGVGARSSRSLLARRRDTTATPAVDAQAPAGGPWAAGDEIAPSGPVDGPPGVDDDVDPSGPADGSWGVGGEVESSEPAAGSRSVGDATRARRLAVLGLGALVLGLAVMAGSSHGERHAFPMRNVYEVRVLPYPDRVAWFADHGMPQSQVFAGPAAREPYVDPAGGPPVVYVPDDDVELARWLDWVETDGRAAFTRYVATHPLFLVSEPLRAPERTFNNAFGDRSFYEPLDMPHVPLVDGLLAWRTLMVLAVGIAVLVWARAGGRRLSPALTIGVVLAVLSMPHGLVAWHSDGMETARHLVVPALQLHLGVLLMVMGLLPVAGSDARRARDADQAVFDDPVAGGDTDADAERVIEPGMPGVASPHG